jgi:hypothetical protein
VADPEESPLTPEVVADALGALAGYGAGGPEGAVAGAAMTAPLTRLAGLAWDELRQVRAVQVGRLVEVASDLTRTEPERMLREALSDSATRVLLHEAMQAAAATLDEQKVDALAQALANGLDDGTKVDYEVLIIRALSDLDPVHVRVLRMLNGAKSENKRFSAKDIQAYIDPASVDDVNWMFEGVDFTPAVIATLERHGLVETRDEPVEGIDERLNDRTTVPFTQRAYSISNFGINCLDHLFARRRTSNT